MNIEEWIAEQEDLCMGTCFKETDQEIIEAHSQALKLIKKYRQSMELCVSEFGESNMSPLGDADAAANMCGILQEALALTLEDLE